MREVRLVLPPNSALDIEGQEDKENQETTVNNTYTKLQSIFSCNKNIILSTVAESSVATIWATLTTAYLDENTEWYRHPFTLMSAMLSLNALIRTLKSCPAINNEYVQAAFYGFFDHLTRSALVHEAGHAITASVLFRAPTNTRITINPPEGLTNYDRSNGLTDIGNFFGPDASRSLVTAMGTGTELLWNGFSLLAAQLISDNHSQIKARLRFSVLFSMANHIVYALGALDDSNCINSNDFCNLEKRAGISPTAAVIFMVAMALVVQLTLSCCSKLKKRLAVNTEEKSSPDVDLDSASYRRLA